MTKQEVDTIVEEAANEIRLLLSMRRSTRTIESDHVKVQWVGADLRVDITNIPE